MGNSIETRGFIRTCILLGLSIYLATMNGVDCGRVRPARRSLVGETIFDVMQYGAKADGLADDAMAFIQAWKAACDSSGPAKVVINGNFMVGEVVFTGPCINLDTITIEILGNVSANSDPSSYSHMAWIMLQRVQNVEITGGGTLNAHGQDFWAYASDGSPLPVSLVLQAVSNCKLYNLNFVDSMGFHSKVTDSHDVSVYNLTITAPETSPNTDGLHLSNATNVNVTDSIIGTGDDCISIGQGSVNVLISGITCGPGHGISIGSLGKREEETSVQGITVKNCTLTGTTNGARIKTFHDSPQLNASGIIYQDIVMNQVKNPIIIDQHYSSKSKPEQSSVKISDVHFINIKGTTISPIPVNLDCSTKFPCENIELADIDLAPVGSIILKSACASAQSVLLKGIQNPPGPACV
ncbi:exopolygalacturonase clone gbge184 [Phtheirospermum japonicum]|uniref:Exopolygalacturonase clone gbge184 n=1 Tax=Phtheirospermum japonicum TaxID=374723 RepID=A0A830D7A9_9LAMI|nr:exopolygalacturonase clone gbge184 [Phtheirospermum japonicum]